MSTKASDQPDSSPCAEMVAHKCSTSTSSFPELWLELCCAEGALDLLLAAVDGRVALGADVERVELVVVQLVLVRRVLVARLEYLPRLLRHLWLGPQLKQPPGECSTVPFQISICVSAFMYSQN